MGISYYLKYLISMNTILKEADDQVRNMYLTWIVNFSRGYFINYCLF